MKLFVDTANTEEIRKAAALGVICGVTTNPSLIAKEGADLQAVMQKIVEIVNGPISAEVMGDTAEEMIDEGVALSQIHQNIVVKIPMTAEGMKAVKALSQKGVRTNVTLVFTANQALLAARAGASFVSPFVGRLDDIGADGVGLISEIAQMFDLHGIETEIIAASIREPQSVTACALAGAHIATVPYRVITQMLHHPLTDAGIARFKADAQK